ncbi:AraC family transcriptional regulator [Victivallis sp. Marseille-Q1083]|uniref:helix-turn-helix domain-containing protein n=1 Tax=Victivallis sp. Marseille-Q1083 TaxID=2717288 RepID=UPI00158E2916|nr:AraC family transcriptional regulator [Victivallis sp. Marseille-Q1083]
MEISLDTPIVFEFACGDVTVVEPGHHTGWRQFPQHVLVINAGDHRGRCERAASPAVHFLPQTGILVRAQTRHRFITREMLKNGISIWCHFQVSIFHRLDLLDFFDLPDFFPAATVGPLRKSLLKLLRPPAGLSPLASSLHRQSAGLALVGELIRHGTPRPEKLERVDDLHRLAPALRQLHSHLAARPTLAALAGTVHLSESRFAALFKATIGVSPLAYWQNLRLDRAHQLLSTGQYNSEETAAELGFYDVFHFIKCFKKRFGVTPAAFRRQPPTVF